MNAKSRHSCKPLWAKKARLCGVESPTVLWSADFSRDLPGPTPFDSVSWLLLCGRPMLGTKVTRKDRLPQRTLQACGEGRGIHERRLVLAAGNVSPESHCTTAHKWCDLGRVILPA